MSHKRGAEHEQEEPHPLKDPNESENKPESEPDSHLQGSEVAPDDINAEFNEVDLGSDKPGYP